MNPVSSPPPHSGNAARGQTLHHLRGLGATEKPSTREQRASRGNLLGGRSGPVRGRGCWSGRRGPGTQPPRMLRLRIRNPHRCPLSPFTEQSLNPWHFLSDERHNGVFCDATDFGTHPRMCAGGPGATRGISGLEPSVSPPSPGRGEVLETEIRHQRPEMQSVVSL